MIKFDSSAFPVDLSLTSFKSNGYWMLPWPVKIQM